MKLLIVIAVDCDVQQAKKSHYKLLKSRQNRVLGAALYYIFQQC
jgi:hypothetical protein